MQDCFREHPDIYGDELADPEPDGPEQPELAGAVDSAVESVAEDTPVSVTPSVVPPPSESPLPSRSSDSQEQSQRTPPPQTLSNPVPKDADNHPAHTSDDDDRVKIQKAKTAREQVRCEHIDPGENGEELVPKEWHDTRRMNESK